VGLPSSIIQRGTRAAQSTPTAGQAGILYYVTDEEVTERWSGTAWESFADTGSGYAPGGTDVALADGGTGASLADPNDDRILFWDDSGGAVTWLDQTNGVEISGTNLQLTTAQRTRTVGITIDGGGEEIATGVHGFVQVPVVGTITAARMFADQSGSIVIDVWKDTYVNFPPTDADSITSATPPTISTAQKSEDTTLSSWTTSISAGDVLGFNVDSVTDITRVTLQLTVTVT
jgi:hypothetical protein